MIQQIKKRLLVSMPIFLLTFVILQVNFDILWRYFAWTNQTLAVFTLWAITVYLCRRQRNFYVAIVPALFMTAVSVCYILVAPEGFGLPGWMGNVACAAVVLTSAIAFAVWKHKRNY